MIAAIVPAAGKSTRMGRPKLLMSLDGATLLHRVVTALRQGGVERVVVVVPPADSPEGPLIADEARHAGADVVNPVTRPADMRMSVELGLARLRSDVTPKVVLLAPADAPGISADLVARLVETALGRPGSIVVPFHEGRRGHPLVLPWNLAEQIPALPAGAGVNALVARSANSIVALNSANPDVLVDLDTPEDWDKWRCRSLDNDPMNQDAGSNSFDRSPLPTTKMQVRVRLFAIAKERAGRAEILIELLAPATIADLRTALCAHFIELAPLWSSALIAIDEEYADDEATISPDSQIAVIPPVSGGARTISTARHDHSNESFTIDD